MLLLLSMITVIQSSVLPSFPHHHAIIRESRNTVPLPCNSTCNVTCQDCINGECHTLNTFCYIGHQCYVANQTGLNSSLSCLQCRPDKDQTQWTFNPQCSAGSRCFNDTFLKENICDYKTIIRFYKSHEEALINLYNFDECGRDRKQCQAGFFFPKPKYAPNPLACCAGYFCPEGQLCMIPCRPGSFCPTELKARDGTCQSVVQCPVFLPNSYDLYGCGGSTFEGFCPAGAFCQMPNVTQPCPNGTKYCPTGVQEPQPCPSYFICMKGKVKRALLIRHVTIAVVVIVFVLVLAANIYQYLTLKKKSLEQIPLDNTSKVSNYFKKRMGPASNHPRFQLNIYLTRAKLRNVTRFDNKRNEGFTGSITAGRLTALMGGSGCGKSSLLETIHGRRRLQENGDITFGRYKPLDNVLTDYVGYVPQADIMHDDLTVFETVYYSARTRRLNDSHETIKDDVRFVLSRLGLGNMHNSLIKTLSGGQRKRVNVAMEIAACPKVLLLDEPTSGLDTAACDHLFDLLELIKDNAAGLVTIIMVIHQPSHELFHKIDDIFFLTPNCCLAYQGPRDKAKEHLMNLLCAPPSRRLRPRHNDCDTCFIMLTKAPEYIENHATTNDIINQQLETYSCSKRAFLPFFYVMLRSIQQIYVRRTTAEAAYLVAYFLLGTCIGYLFKHKQQDACSIKVLPTIYFLISLAFGMLTCISSQRLFGVEMTDKTFERESRNYFHPFQYWLAKSLVDIFRMIFYPLLFLSMLYIQIIPRGLFSYYLGVMILLSFFCSGIGQLTSVIFKRTEYAYLAATIVALLSCLLSGFNPTKADLGGGKHIVIFSFSRHVQRLLFSYETAYYVQVLNSNGLEEYYSFNDTENSYFWLNSNASHVWSTQVKGLEEYYSFNDTENSYFWLISIGFVLRAITLLFLYGKSEYRSRIRFGVTHMGPIMESFFRCEFCHVKAPGQTYERIN